MPVPDRQPERLEKRAQLLLLVRLQRPGEQLDELDVALEDPGDLLDTSLWRWFGDGLGCLLAARKN